jgi:hypothetical protein
VEAVNVIIRLLSKESFVSGLRNFIERFKGRIVEMASKDTDEHVALAALNLLNEMDR